MVNGTFLPCPGARVLASRFWKALFLCSFGESPFNNEAEGVRSDCAKEDGVGGSEVRGGASHKAFFSASNFDSGAYQEPEEAGRCWPPAPGVSWRPSPWTSQLSPGGANRDTHSRRVALDSAQSHPVGCPEGPEVGVRAADNVFVKGGSHSANFCSLSRPLCPIQGVRVTTWSSSGQS